MNLDYFKKFSNYSEKKDTGNEVWLYTRVSSKNQFETNSSIENQKLSAYDYVKNNNYVISTEFGGTYESAKGDFSRKEFKKLFDAVKASKKKPRAILIFKMNRFSRTGGNAIGLVNELIHVLGVHLIEITSGKNTFTPRGEAEIMDSLLQARKEQLERLEHTIPGLITHVKNGDWLGKAPKGYNHFGKKVKNANNVTGTQSIVISEEGKILQKAWGWKLQGEQDFIIREKLRKLGVDVSKQLISAMWRNPFYCGISTHNFLKGAAIKGKWEAMVSVKDFQTINAVLGSKPNVGYKQSKFSEGRPLQSILYCGECGTKMTGYKAKKIFDYYKCQNKDCSCMDMNAKTTVKSLQKGLNDIFMEYLNSYSLDPKYTNAFKAQMKLTIAQLEKEQKTDKNIITNRIKETQSKLEILEKKNIFDSIDNIVYQKFKSEILAELRVLNEANSKLNETISNLDKKIDSCTMVAQNINNYWCSGSIETKTRIQNLVFPNGIVVNPENRQYRTEKVNLVFVGSALISRSTEDVNEKRQPISQLPSSMVAGTGLEPMTFGL